MAGSGRPSTTVERFGLIVIKQDFLPYARQTIEQDDIDAVIDVLRSDYLTTGPKVQEFEACLCEITGAQYAVACGNGSEALHLALMASGIGPGDVVIVPTVTFLASANAVRYCGADVVFCDVDPENGLVTPEILQKIITLHEGQNLKAFVPVYLGGHCVDLKPLKTLCEQYGLLMIADACHALGGQYEDTPVGSCQYEDMSTFSFHPAKLTTMGEGGAITLNDAQKADTMRRLRHHGMVHKPENGPWFYEMEALGYNYRVTDIQCALGVSQLGKLKAFHAKRVFLTDLYTELLSGLEYVQTPQVPDYCVSGWHLYALRIDFERIGLQRAALMEALKKSGIGTQVHYIPVHTQPYYQKLYGQKALEGAQAYYEKTLSLPLFPSMDKDDVRRIVKTLKGVIEGAV
ncbi:MAG: UDP-4-amino-4,6-dideoxy-N-acetyl-beta-L-altrosamine transaminase [Rhodospirillales bacterium]|nr:UDP-4-amino-4,6-dideoxy-N-acetyl-beta-L-altrosamine transaminase [Rhodospirillales bacterium]